MNTGEIAESPKALLARFSRSIEHQDCIVFAIDAEMLEGTGPAAKIGHLIRWALGLLDEETLRASPSFGLFINRRLTQWFSGESCVCLYVTAGESDLALGKLKERIEGHPASWPPRLRAGKIRMSICSPTTIGASTRCIARLHRSRCSCPATQISMVPMTASGSWSASATARMGSCSRITHLPGKLAGG